MQPVKLVSDISHPTASLFLHALDQTSAIHCPTAPGVCQDLRIAFAGLCIDPNPGESDLECTVTITDTGFMLESESPPVPADDLGDLIYHLDKRFTLALQRARKDLCFLHAGAVIAPDGRAIVLTAASGSGKSTLTWALLHHGFDYLSDELAPIDPGTLVVHGYPHALCLKRQPPAPYPLPPATLVTSRSMHVPIAGSSHEGQLAAIFFVDHHHPVEHPVLTEITPARAAMYLYANTLNPLAHPNEGLDTIAAIAQSVPSYQLNSWDLSLACNVVRTMFSSSRK
jgi:hypothetical protein